MVSQSESLFFFSRETHDEDCHKYVDSWHYWASVIIYGNGDILEEGVVGWVGRRRRRETEECSYCTAGMKMQS